MHTAGESNSEAGARGRARAGSTRLIILVEDGDPPRAAVIVPDDWPFRNAATEPGDSWQLETGARRWPAETGDGPPSPVLTSDALSLPEREVLRYLPSALSAAEIGAELNLSVNAVKARLRSVYRKLGVSRRRDAVVRARRYGLL